MKPKNNFLVALIVFTAFASHAKALSGTVTLGGTGCLKTGDVALTPIAGSKDRYRIPLTLALQKNVGTAIERKSCLFRLPVDVAANEKVVIRDLAQAVKLSADKNVAVESQLDVSIVGASAVAKPVINKIKASSKSAKLSKTFKVGGIIAQSACGQSTMVAGNLSARATGANKASAAIGALDLSISIERCN